MGDEQFRLPRHRVIWVTAFITALATLQCGGNGVSPEKPHASPAAGRSRVIPFSTLAKGVHSAITEPLQAAIRAEADWRQLWSEHVAGLVPSPPVPQVDFRTHMVIAVFRGNTESGFPMQITQIEERPTELAVFFEELSPPPGLPLGGGVIRQPYHIVLLELIPLPVVFQKTP